MIPLFWPPAQDVDRMVNEIRGTLLGRWWGQGPRVDEFERRFAEKFGFEHCVMTSSGTAALHLAYRLAGIEPGDKVIVPVLTCTATCHALLYCGAEIVFADIDPETMTMAPGEFDLLMEKHRTRLMCFRPKALVLVHLGGYVDPRLVRLYPVPVIEDAAQALGAERVGTIGDFTCFSFQAIKALSTGDGGMLVCRKEEDRQRAKRLRWFAIDREEKARKNWQAWDRRGITFDQEEIGYKYQPTDIDAAIGLAALNNFDGNQVHRHALVKKYIEVLKNVEGIRLFKTDGSSDWLFMVSIEKGSRDDLADHLTRYGIETNVAHIRNDVFGVFGGKRQGLPSMDLMEDRYICLPLNNQVGFSDVDYIGQVISDYMRTT